MKIGFIGLGVMGAPMAQNLQSSGQHELLVCDIDPQRVALLEKQGAEAVQSIAAIAAQADVVLTSLPGPRQIEAVGFGVDGLLANMRPGSAWIDLSTNDLPCAAKIAETALAAGIDILDAPVSGGDEGARAANLTVLVGGEPEVFERYRPLFEIIGERVDLLGAHGSGYAAKIAQVVLCYLHSLALSEALMLGVKGGCSAAQNARYHSKLDG